jgi:hypothetical protein
MTFRPLAVFLAVVLLSPTARGAEPKEYIRADPKLVLQPVPAGLDVILPLERGQPAPLTGQLFSQETALRWGHYLEQAQDRYSTQTNLLLAKANAEIELRERLLAAERTAHQQMQALALSKLETAEKRLANPPWYQTFWAGMLTGVVVTVATAAGLVAITR